MVSPVAYRQALALKQEAALWPKECLESQKKFGHKAARIYPLLGKEIQTPQGKGVLLQAFEARAAVAFAGQSKAVFFKPEDIRLCDELEKEESCQRKQQ